jgi:hypothetical protein
MSDQVQESSGVEAAQAFIVPSYQWMLVRLEAADSRIHTLLTFVATVTFAVPTLGRAIRPDIPLESPPLFIALLIALSICGFGLYARTRGGVQLPHPQKFYDRWREKSKRQFDRDALYFAAQAFEDNRRLVEWKADAVNRMSGLFAVELLFFFVWISRV